MLTNKTTNRQHSSQLRIYSSSQYAKTRSNTSRITNINTSSIQLPVLSIKQRFRKIIGKCREQYVPNKQDYKIYRRQKEEQLRRKYGGSVLREQNNYEDCIDDMLQNKQNKNGNEIYRQYKSNLQQLTYKTLKVLSYGRKRIL